MAEYDDFYLPMLPDGEGRFGYCPPGLVEGWMEVEYNLRENSCFSKSSKQAIAPHLLHKALDLVVIWILDPDLPVVSDRAGVVRVSRILNKTMMDLVKT